MAGGQECTSKDDVDIWRDTWVRYFGYCNEVGEAFRPLLPRLVAPSYGASFLYVLCDTADKGMKAKVKNAGASDKEASSRKVVVAAAADTLIWQTLASVLVPGFTINQIVKVAKRGVDANAALFSASVKPRATTWLPTLIGLAFIPVIIHPIDSAVHVALDYTTRPVMSRWAGSKVRDDGE